jgi:hypothetical protein
MLAWHLTFLLYMCECLRVSWFVDGNLFSVTFIIHIWKYFIWVTWQSESTNFCGSRCWGVQFRIALPDEKIFKLFSILPFWQFQKLHVIYNCCCYGNKCLNFSFKYFGNFCANTRVSSIIRSEITHSGVFLSVKFIATKHSKIMKMIIEKMRKPESCGCKSIYSNYDFR